MGGESGGECEKILWFVDFLLKCNSFVIKCNEKEKTQAKGLF